MAQIFLSYSRRDQASVRSLVRDLEDLGHEIWLDEELTGGQVWWNQVLTNICGSDLFVFALSPPALESHACKLEYTYAYNLNKIILPVLLADGVRVNLLPQALSTIQYVDWRTQDRKATIDLVRALNHLPPPNPLPDPLPEPPAVPVSYLSSLKEQIETTAVLSFQDQSALLLSLKERLENVEEREDVRSLLVQLRDRDDLLARIAKEIDDLLKSTSEAGAKKRNQPTSKKSRREQAPVTESETDTSNLEAVSNFSNVSVELATTAEQSVVDKLTGRKIINYRGHAIEIRGQSMTGEEKVFYDGKEVSKKRSLLGATHVFRVHEDGKNVVYEVELGARISLLTWFEVRRNGQVIYSDR